MTSDLSWSRHTHETCLRANRKLAVLRRVKYLKRHTLDLLYKITVRSIIDYGLVLYYYNCTDKEKARYDRIQYNAARLVSSTLKYTSKEKLFLELGWETIENRAYILGICMFHKIAKGETRPLLKSLLPKLNITNNYNLRNLRLFRPFPFKGVKYSKSFFPYFTKNTTTLTIRPDNS